MRGCSSPDLPLTAVRSGSHLTSIPCCFTSLTPLGGYSAWNVVTCDTWNTWNCHMPVDQERTGCVASESGSWSSGWTAGGLPDSSPFCTPVTFGSDPCCGHCPCLELTLPHPRLLPDLPRLVWGKHASLFRTQEHPFGFWPKQPMFCHCRPRPPYPNPSQLLLASGLPPRAPFLPLLRGGSYLRKRKTSIFHARCGQ